MCSECEAAGLLLGIQYYLLCDGCHRECLAKKRGFSLLEANTFEPDTLVDGSLATLSALMAGTHAEGGIWATLFGLLMWDVLFMDIPDVFQTAFQTAPLDLGTVVFYPTRQAAIEERLAQIRAGQAIALLQHCWQQHLGEWCRGVNWERHSEIPLTCNMCQKGCWFKYRVQGLYLVAKF